MKPLAVKPLVESKLLIIGLGLVGGSIARGLKKANSRQWIMAVDSNEAALAEAKQDGTIDESGPLESLCRQADIIVLAVPAMATAQVVRELVDMVRDTAVITDVASVKSHILESVNRLDDNFVRRFVPGHPIAGSEQSGYGAGDATLFQNRIVILTPQPSTHPDAVAVVNSLWRDLGARVLGMFAGRHDQLLAATSHLPHLLAFGIIDVLARQAQSDDIFRYAAGGFADFSRLASSDARMWSDIFMTNGPALAPVLDAYIEELLLLKQVIMDADQGRLMEILTGAKATRDRFVARHFQPSQALPAVADELSFQVEPGGRVSGSLRVPGDKSISHRSIIFGAIADGVTRVKGFLEGEDALNTVAALREMGVTITGPETGELMIHGVGKDGLQAPRETLYLGNSGTAMRLLAGLLAAQSFDSELAGDDSLSRRPMERVATPLRSMGAHIVTQEDGTPPLRITGSSLHGIRHDMAIASAQVKSCLLLAGLYAEGETTVSEPAPCRDHTERMLAGFSYPLQKNEAEHSVTLSGGHRLRATTIDVPGDISSAAFFMVAAAVSPGSSLTLRHVGVNPTRSGVITLLRAMGADLHLSNEKLIGGEPVADITISYRPLRGIRIPAQQIPLAIDEFPVLFIAAACAGGETLLRGAEELRVKESDRIAVMAQGLTTLGIATETFDDGIRIVGGTLGGGEIDSHGDHRIAMAFSVAGLRASAPITIRNCANVATSFPGFTELARSVGIGITAVNTGKP